MRPLGLILEFTPQERSWAVNSRILCFGQVNSVIKHNTSIKTHLGSRLTIWDENPKIRERVFGFSLNGNQIMNQFGSEFYL